jgi:hypothetical protein
MFWLRDQTRRRLLLAAFCLFCVLPSVAVLAWGTSRHWPGYVGREAEELSRQLGLHVSLSGLKYARPGAMLYEGLKVTDPEMGQLLLHCRRLEAQWGSDADAQGKRASVLVLRASQPELQAEGLPRLWQLLGRVLQRDYGITQLNTHLVAADVAIQSGEGVETLTSMEGEIESAADRTEAKLEFRLAGMEMPEPACIRVLRNRQVMPPASTFELNTRGSALPCRLLAMGIDTLRPLGSHARFRGNVWANQTRDGTAADNWEGELLGHLSDVDLGTVLGERFPHQLSGMAQLAIQSAHFHQGRLEDCACEITAGPGFISRSLLDAAVQRLMLIPGPEASLPGDPLPYQQLSLAATIDLYGLQVYGRCPSAGRGAILVGPQGLLLGQPVLQPQPVVALLQMLVPANEVQVPASRQTDWLLRHLPIPPVLARRDVKMAVPGVESRQER